MVDIWEIWEVVEIWELVEIFHGNLNKNAPALVHKGMLLLLLSPMNLRPSRCRFGVYEEDVKINRNPFTGATSIVKEDEFIPMGGGGNMGYGYGGGFGN